MNIAIITIGGLESKKITEGNEKQRELSLNGNFLEPCYKGIYNHIQKNNSKHKFDYFLSHWVSDINNQNTKNKIERMKKLYNPKGFHFENYRNLPREYSFLLSMRIGLHLALQQKKYDYIFFIRPDALLWKNIDIDNLELDKIYRNDGVAHTGDFYFSMNLKNALIFVQKPMYIRVNNMYGLSGYITDLKLVKEILVAGKDIELYWKNFNWKKYKK